MALTTNAIYALIFAFSLVGAPGAQAAPVLAADSGTKVEAPGGMGPHGWNGEWCKENPEACKEHRARKEQWCKDNPEKCAKMKEHREWCKANPEECKAQREKRREAWCQENPEKCAKMKEIREICKTDREKCREEHRKMREEWCKEAPGKCDKMRHGPGPMRNGDGKPDSNGSDD